MALVFRRSMAIPLWALAFFAIALAAPPRSIPPISVLLGIAVFALTMMAMVQWRRISRAPVLVAPLTRNTAHAGIIMAAISRRTLVETRDDAAPVAADMANTVDLVRMDDDGGWQVPRRPALPIVLIPGAREPGTLTTFGTSSPIAGIGGGPGAMDATTIAERQREGGGSPKYRLPLTVVTSR